VSRVSSELPRMALALKLSQIKRATRSYLRDRTNQATGTVASYAIAAALFAVSVVFFLSACIVGAAALFRWIEVNYGLFPAFGAIGTLLLAAAAISGVLATSYLKRPPRQFPSLISRLRVAIKAKPVHADRVQAVRDTASMVLYSPSATGRQTGSGVRSQRESLHIYAGLILMAALLGWAATVRRQQLRRPQPNAAAGPQN
jgi:hypothetical protein